MPEIVVQSEIGGMTVALTVNVGDDMLDATLDRYGKALSRQRAHGELIEALVELRARRDTLAQWPELRAELAKRRAAERVRLVASFTAAHEAAGRRSVFHMTPQHRQAMAQFDAQTAEAEKKLLDEKEKCEREIPLYETRVARQRAIIEGAERSDLLDDRPADSKTAGLAAAAD